MKKIPTFTLVRRSSLPEAPRTPTGAIAKKAAVKPVAKKATAKPAAKKASARPAAKPAAAPVAVAEPTIAIGAAKRLAAKNAARAKPVARKPTEALFQVRAMERLLAQKRLKHAFVKLDDNFKAALESTLVRPDAKGSSRSSTEVDAKKLAAITEDLAREPKVLKVGVLDLGTWAAGLPDLLERMNDAQSMFTLFEIMSPVPSGLVKTPEGFRAWVKEKRPTSRMRFKVDELVPQIIFDDYYVAAEDIRKNMGLDILVGITPERVAGLDDDGKPFWDHFTTTDEKVTLVSTADLRRYAEEANRPFEAAVGMLLVTSLFTSIVSKLDYHKVETGCIFDDNKERDGLRTCIANLMIDQGCLKVMKPSQRTAAQDMLAALRRMKRRKPK